MEEIEAFFNEKFVSVAFEDYVKEIITLNPREYLGFVPRKIGRWWDNSNEIDLVAIGEDRVAFIECKWRNQPVDYSIYNALIQKAEKVNIPPNLEKEYVFFAKSGFKGNVENAEGRFITY
jgi:uncharacterized protein